MVTASSSSSASPPLARGDASAAQGAQRSGASQPPGLTDQGRFERALDRAAQRLAPPAPRAHQDGDRDASDDDADATSRGEPVEPAQRSDINVHGDIRPEAPHSGLPSDHVLALSVSTACVQALPWAAPIETPPAPAGLSMEQFSAALARLQAPAQAHGAQQWQFGLVDTGGPLQGVQLQMPAQGAHGSHGAGLWQVSVYSSARDRGALQAHLDKLRDRLQARGARVGDVRMDDGDLPG
jgi:hypothetical protein